MVKSCYCSSVWKVTENDDSLYINRTRLFDISGSMKKNYDLTMTESLFFDDSHDTSTPVFLVQIFGCIYFDLMTDSVIKNNDSCDRSIPEVMVQYCH